VVSAASQAADQALEGLRQAEGRAAQQQATPLGLISPGKAVTISWTFSNSSSDVWPAGARLSFIGGRLCPPSGLNPDISAVTIPPGSSFTAQATMVAPQEPGPCDAQWQLEDSDGSPLSPPVFVRALVPSPLASVGPVLSATGTSSEVTCRAADAPSMSGRLSYTPRSERSTLPTLLSGAMIGLDSCSETPAKLPSRNRALILPAGECLKGDPCVEERGASFFFEETPRMYIRLSATPVAVAAAATGELSAVDGSWARAFEEFFGRDCTDRLCPARGARGLDGGSCLDADGDAFDAEVSQMANQVYGYMKRQRLNSLTDALGFDENLLHIYTPVMAPSHAAFSYDSSRETPRDGYCLRDISLLTRQVVALYRARWKLGWAS